MMKRQIKIFLLGLIPMFLLVVLQQLGFQPAKLISPMPERVEIIDQIRPKLEEIKNDFQIKDSPNLVAEAVAAGDYDQAFAYGVIDLNNGEVLKGKNISERLPIASITKLMTAVVALDLSDPEEVFTVSARASAQIPTKVMLKEGEKVSVEVLIKSALISSANDAAQVLKEGVDQKFGEDIFIQAMNEKAKAIGMKHTNFSNPQGFDSPKNYSSVADLATLSHYIFAHYPLITRVVSRQIEDLSDVLDERFYLRNWNGLLGTYPGTYGLKIGNDREARFATVVAAERGEAKLLAVVLGAPGVIERDLWAAQLLDSGFSKYGLEPINITEAQLLNKYSTWNR